MPTHQMTRTLADLAKVSRGEMKLADASTFMSYFNMSGRTLDSNPKFFFFSAHAEQLAPLIRFFHLQSKVPFLPVPSAMLIFNYYSEAGKFWVEGNYVAGDTDTPFLNMKSEYFEQMSLSVVDGYAAMMGSDDMKTVCEMPFDQATNVSMSAASEFKSTLYETYDFNPPSSSSNHEFDYCVIDEF